MIGNHDSAGKQNPAWRAFWVKICEMNARAADPCREELIEQENDVSAIEIDKDTSLRMITDDKKYH